MIKIKKQTCYVAISSQTRTTEINNRQEDHDLTKPKAKDAEWRKHKRYTCADVKSNWVIRVTPSLNAECVPTGVSPSWFSALVFSTNAHSLRTKILDERGIVRRMFENLPFRCSLSFWCFGFFLFHAVNRNEFGKFIELRRATENEALPVNYDPVCIINTHSP